MTLRLNGVGADGDQRVADLLGYIAACAGFEITINARGEVSRSAGTADAEHADLVEELDAMIASRHTLTISVTRGSSTAVIDDFATRCIDLDDFEQLPHPAPAATPDAFTRCESLVHIFAEYAQAQSQGRVIGGNGYREAHRHAFGAQGDHRQANGQDGTVTSQRGNSARTSGTITYSNGATTTMTLQDGNITSVSHTAAP